jgi:hypothetical protein
VHPGSPPPDGGAHMIRYKLAKLGTIAMIALVVGCNKGGF